MEVHGLVCHLPHHAPHSTLPDKYLKLENIRKHKYIVHSAQFTVHSTKCKIQSPEFKVPNAKCTEQSAKYKVPAQRLRSVIFASRKDYGSQSLRDDLCKSQYLQVAMIEERNLNNAQ